MTNMVEIKKTDMVEIKKTDMVEIKKTGMIEKSNMGNLIVARSHTINLVREQNFKIGRLMTPEP